MKYWGVTYEMHEIYALLLNKGPTIENVGMGIESKFLTNSSVLFFWVHIPHIFLTDSY